MLALFVIVIAAAEVGLGLAILLLLFRHRASVAVDAPRELADRDQPPERKPLPQPEEVRR